MPVACVKRRLKVRSVRPARDAVEGADSFVIENGKILFQSIHYGLVRNHRVQDDGVTEDGRERRGG